MFYKRNSEKGFTLIELLVVIAIIGILSSVVLASLNDARRKSRDARRVSDIKQIQLALEFYFDAERTYPANTDAAHLVAPGYIAQVPLDPTTDAVYPYMPVNPAIGADCTSYQIGAILEDQTHVTLDSDVDLSGLTKATSCRIVNSTGPGDTEAAGGVASFHGDSLDCIGGTPGTDQCFDVAP